MHSVVVSNWRAASAPDAITASTSYSTKYLGPPISTRQQSHASKACGRSFRIRGSCGNWQRINLVHKAFPQVQDVCANTLFKSPWPAYPLLSVLLCSHGGGSGKTRCSSTSSVWRRSSPSAEAPDKAERTETELWEEYFADPSQWWDNRIDKVSQDCQWVDARKWMQALDQTRERNPRSPDFKHKVTREALWLDGWKTPTWVKARLKLVTEVELQSHVGFGMRDCGGSTPPNRLPKDNVGKKKSMPASAREMRQIVQAGDGSMHTQRASATNEAIAIVKARLDQGITIDSYMYVEVLKRCLKQKDLIAAKQVHDCMVKSGMEQNTYVANNLLSVYIRCGRLQVARQVFDKLLNKNVYSWTIMIGGYAQHNCAKKALEVFNQMRQQGVQPNEVTYVSLLKAFASPAALKWGKEVHAYINHDGLERHVRVCNALVHMYVKSGSINNARQVFNGMENRNVITWNILIGGLADHRRGQEAYECYLQMRRGGCVPNAITYVSILNACASAGALEWVKDVHSHILAGGLESDLCVANALVHMYAKSGSIDDARLVFDRMEVRDVITWSVMIGGLADHGRGQEAYECFLQMQREGCVPNTITYVSILNACASVGALEWVRDVHSHILAGGLESDVRVASALVHMYAKSGSIDDARQVFDRMEERDVITWSVMIGGLADHARGHEAYECLLQMGREGFVPNAITYVSILNACASAGALEWVKDVHSHILVGGLESDVRVANALVHMYAKCGSIDDARQVFHRMGERNVITWSGMIGGLAEHGCGHEAYECFLQMRREGCVPDAITYVSILKACAGVGALVWVRDVHSHILAGGLESDVRVANALVHMYAKSSSIDDARQVFDRMEERDVITWSMMIGGLADHGRGHEAYECFRQMQREGCVPDAITYVSILNACASAGALEWLKDVHSHILAGGLESDVRVANALVHMYAKSGSIDDARLVFDRMEERDVITWSVMIGGLADHGRGQEAYECFLQMQREGCVPNTITYVSILNACASVGALEWVRDVHSHILAGGLESDVQVASALVHMYAKSGSIDDARLVFDRMEECNVITWNVMIGGLADHGRGHEAYECFLQMGREGFVPNAITYVSILNVCASAGALEWVKDVHSHILAGGLDSDLRVGNALVHMYAKCGSIDDARQVFDRMEEHNVITWNMMIGGLADHGRGHEAYECFLQMQREGCVPDAITYVSILNACASEGALEWVQDVHSHILATGLEKNLRVGNALVHMYAKGGSIDDARQVFDRMEERDVITWNVMIGGLAHHGRGHEAYECFLQMRREACIPNAITYVSILNACASAGALEWVEDVHSHILAGGLESDLRVANALVHMYAKSGSINDARQVFDRMEVRDVITWSVLIGGLADHGRGHEAYECFLQMQREGCVPNAITYVSILNACASAGALEWVKDVHSHIQAMGLEKNLRVANALVHMYAKSGSIDDSRQVFDRIKERDVITWNVMISGLAHHGCGYEALEVFREMIGDGVKPDGFSFVAVLSACSHTGLVDEGRRLFLAMSLDYGIEPTVLHFACMVDLLGRAGQLEEAKLLIVNMPVKPDGATWGALLGACRTYGNVELGELAAKELFKLEPKGSSPYVLLSNIYAAGGKWEEVSLVRSMMQDRGIRKEPGRSWIVVDNKVHDFVVGDTSHPEAKEIYAELNRLTDRIKAEGYIPDTRLVLKNMAEEDKELALCSHSEKLAIAYGLLRTAGGKPIRVYKNLRVCSDCHAATKLISKVTGREIVARDANRFHHFKDGVCSCGDYW